MLVHLDAVSELCGGVEDGVEAMLREGGLNESSVAEIACDAGEARKRVFIGFEVDVDNGVSFAQKPSFEDSAEEAGTSCDKYMSHKHPIDPFTGWYFGKASTSPSRGSRGANS